MFFPTILKGAIQHIQLEKIENIANTQKKHSGHFSYNGKTKNGIIVAPNLPNEAATP